MCSHLCLLCLSKLTLSLADPTITQTFFGHINCRALSDSFSVLEKDYSVECSGTQWWVLAVLSALGILVISIGFPVGMFVWCATDSQGSLRPWLSLLSARAGCGASGPSR